MKKQTINHFKASHVESHDVRESSDPFYNSNDLKSRKIHYFILVSRIKVLMINKVGYSQSGIFARNLTHKIYKTNLFFFVRRSSNKTILFFVIHKSLITLKLIFCYQPHKSMSR